jgi:hypothetical protein
MPRQKSSFTQRDIDARREFGLGPRAGATKSKREAEIDSIAQKLVPRTINEPARDEFARRLSFILRRHLQRACVEVQERPTKIIVTLKAGLEPVRSVLEYLRALPMSVRFRLGAVDVEDLLSELNTNIQKQVRDWSKRKVPHRPPGARQLWQDLRDDLYELYSKHHLDDQDPNENATKRRQRERQFCLQRRRWAADAMRSIQVTFPDEKKNPGLFEDGL